MNRYILLLCIATLPACSVNKFAVNKAADILGPASRAFNSEQDYQFAKEAMPGNLKLIEGLHQISPDNREINTILAKAFCSYAFAFPETEGSARELNRAKSFYQRGYAYGRNGLPSGLLKTIDGSLEDFEKEVWDTDKDDVESLFWTAYCLSGWINLNKADVSAVADLSKAEILMRKVLKEDETFYYGSAHIFFGGFFGSRPKMLGGNPEKARDHIEKAIQISGGRFLPAKFFLATFYAVPAQNESLFEQTLKEVITAKPDELPDEHLANQVAKMRAEKLIKEKKNLF